ncbi:hypothetical protein [Pseudorhodoferax sp. Leaf267]|uniref:hypothetical protein n=1 Tax=Pseudorhodoferax sp. Leaf267 TaxID=1736316 RepID=UPI00071236EB|nr:hypothetical protein [Pseudorhodoferax sp. Leaf267]KQP12652.1 hypothetical protein ASF43_20660 [Pseudorhodoferax sp. Leaf267]
MALSTRQRWMLYGVAGLLTAAAMWAVEPEPTPDTVAPAARPARSAARAADAPTVPPLALAPLPERPFGGAGRSPFGESAAITPAQVAAAAAAAQARADMPPPPPPATATTPTEPPFVFLGRWTEDGVTTVFLSSGGRGLVAVAGRPLTPDYLVESIGERAMQLRHVPTGTRHTLALVAGRPAAAAAAGAALAAPADSEESN